MGGLLRKSSAVVLIFGIAACALRLVLGFRVSVPSTDGATYLWMSEAFAEGRLSEGLSAVFHPGWPLCLSPLVALGLDPMTASVLVGSLAGGVAVGLTIAAVRCVARESSALLAGGFVAIGFHLQRLPADAYSEALFLPCVAALLLAVLKGRLVLAAILVGLSTWIRPEGLLYLAFVLCYAQGLRPRVALVGIALMGAASFAVLRSLLVHELAWTPKFAFMQELGPLGAGDVAGFFARLGEHALAWPSAGVRGLDFVVLPLALLGVIALWTSARRDPERARLARAASSTLVLLSAAMIAFQVKPRFFVGHAAFFALLGAIAIDRAHGLRGWRRWPVGLALIGLFVASLRVGKDLLEPPRSEKRVEIELGHWLGDKGLGPGELLSDLPRVLWAAGQMPLPPRQWTAEGLAPLMDRPSVRWVVLGARRPGRRALIETRQDFVEVELPADLRERLGAARLILARRR